MTHFLKLRQNFLTLCSVLCIIFDVGTYFWCHDVFFDVLTYVLMSWENFYLLMYFMYLMTSFLTYFDVPFDIMTYFWRPKSHNHSELRKRTSCKWWVGALIFLERRHILLDFDIAGGQFWIYWMFYDHLSAHSLLTILGHFEEDEVGLKEKPEDTRYIKKIISK